MEKNSDIYAICQCGYYDFPALRNHLCQIYNAVSYRNVLQLNWQGGEAVVFDYGVVVFWHVAPAERSALLELLKEYAREPLTDLLDDEFSYELNAAQASLKDDHICLNDDDILTRLSVSHGIAQSTKLGQYEARVQKTITSTEYIPESIASTGKSGLKRKELAKMRGFLYLTKSDVALHYDLLDVPEFFWEYPELQSYYSLIADYLEVRPRIEVLNKKLETIQDLLQMIADEQKHAHSSLLEWIIIWLIAIDIVILLVQEFLL
ncbi:MAG: sad1-interacting factor 2 [Gammaproteobacteria bacterium SG8_15]|nr:MAG: sad1-interacting factor 2 [Gammaproteobacteria bacterium SG8_15]